MLPIIQPDQLSSVAAAAVAFALVLGLVFAAARAAVGVTPGDLDFADRFARHAMAGDDRNSNVDAAGGRVDVDARMRRETGYGGAAALPRGGAVVARETRTRDAAVVCLPGLGRCADDFDLVDAWLARGLEPVFCDFRRYGRAFRNSKVKDERFNYAADLRELGEDIDDCVAYAASLGYTSVVLCGLSTGGMALMEWAVALGDAGLKERHVAGLLFCSPCVRMNAVSVPRPVDDVVLGACRVLRCLAPATYAALARSVVLARDSELGADPVVAEGPSWLDKVMAERRRCYDRYLNPCRGKPTWLGYVVAMLEAQKRLNAALAKPGFEKLAIPARCFAPRYDASSPDRPPGPVEPGSKVDEHIDVNEVERVFTTAFAGDFARLDCQHEVLASSPAVVDAVLDAMRAALDAA